MMISLLKLLSIMLIFFYYLHFTESIECLECKSDNDACTTLIGAETIKTCKTDGDFKCYTKIIGDKNERGCETKDTKCLSEDRCISCDEEKCNNRLDPPNRLKCIECSGYECSMNHETKEAIPCIDSIGFCVTYHNESTVIRGCSTVDNKICDPNDKENCESCYEMSCNTKKVKMPFNCYRCRSDVSGQENCAYKNVKGIQPQKCDKELGTEQGKCYTKRANNVVYRGCVIDLFGESIKECNGNNTNICITCSNTPGCNNDKAPGRSAAVGKSISMIFIVVTITILKSI